MKRSAYPLTREEPTLSGAWQSDAQPEDERQTRLAAPLPRRPSRIANLGRGVLRFSGVLAGIVALSYLPEAWIEQQHPHIQDMVDICRDIRELLYRISGDLWRYLQTEVPQWYDSVRSLISTHLSDLQ